MEWFGEVKEIRMGEMKDNQFSLHCLCHRGPHSTFWTALVKGICIPLTKYIEHLIQSAYSIKNYFLEIKLIFDNINSNLFNPSKTKMAEKDHQCQAG